MSTNNRWFNISISPLRNRSAVGTRDIELFRRMRSLRNFHVIIITVYILP